MPRKKTEPAEQTPKKTARSREVKTKPEEAKKNATKSEGKAQPKKPRAKKATAKEKKVEAVEAELVQESNKKKHRYGVNNNLIPNSERTPSELREMTKKGGIKSGETRRAKKNLREFGQWFLMQMTSDAFQPLMDRHGVPVEESTNLASLYVRVFNKAMSTGDLNAARQVVEWAGMAPLQEMRENEAIAKMSQVMQMMQQTNDTEDEDEENDVIIYLPDNGVKVGMPDDYGLNLTEG